MPFEVGQYVRLKDGFSGRVEAVCEKTGRVTVEHGVDDGGAGSTQRHHFDPDDLKLLPHDEQVRRTKVREDWAKTVEKLKCFR